MSKKGFDYNKELADLLFSDEEEGEVKVQKKNSRISKQAVQAETAPATASVTPSGGVKSGSKYSPAPAESTKSASQLSKGFSLDALLVDSEEESTPAPKNYAGGSSPTTHPKAASPKRTVRFRDDQAERPFGKHSDLDDDDDFLLDNLDSGSKPASSALASLLGNSEVVRAPQAKPPASKMEPDRKPPENDFQPSKSATKTAPIKGKPPSPLRNSEGPSSMDNDRTYPGSLTPAQDKYPGDDLDAIFDSTGPRLRRGRSSFSSEQLVGVSRSTPKDPPPALDDPFVLEPKRPASSSQSQAASGASLSLFSNPQVEPPVAAVPRPLDISSSEVEALQRSLSDLRRSLQSKEEDYLTSNLEHQRKSASLELLVSKLEQEKQSLEAQLKSKIEQLSTDRAALEESFRSRAAIVQQSSDLLVSNLKEELVVARQERLRHDEQTTKQLKELEQVWNRSLERLDDQKAQELLQLRNNYERKMGELSAEHEEKVAALRKLKDLEISNTLQVTKDGMSVAMCTQKILQSYQEMLVLQDTIRAKVGQSYDSREALLSAKEEHLHTLQSQLVTQQQSLAQERDQFRVLFTRIEVSLAEERRKAEEALWVLKQTESRVRASEEALQEERRLHSEQFAAWRNSYEKTRQELLEHHRQSQRTITEERRQLDEERMSLVSLHKELSARLTQLSSPDRHQPDPELQATRLHLAKEKDEMARQRERLLEEEHRLTQLRLELETRNHVVSVQTRQSEELRTSMQKQAQESEQKAAENREVARVLQLRRTELESTRTSLETLKENITQQHAIVKEQAYQLNVQQRAVDLARREGLCTSCRANLRAGSMAENSPAPDENPKLMPPLRHQEKPPDLLMTNLELQRALQRLQIQREAEEKFLENESSFLSNLRSNPK